MRLSSQTETGDMISDVDFISVDTNPSLVGTLRRLIIQCKEC